MFTGIFSILNSIYIATDFQRNKYREKGK